MRRRILLTSLLVILVTNQDVAANNTSFLPGDSFFFTRLTKAEILKLQKETNSRFDYGSHWDGGFGCGSAGHETIEFPKMPAAMKTRLLSAYTELESQLELYVYDLPKKKTKMLSVFIYNSHYDWKKHGIAIQYNENWVAETVKFGHRRDHVRLESFVSGATQKAWRDSPLIPPLKAKFPTVRKKGQRVIPTLNGDYQLIVIPKRNFTDYFNYRNKDGLPLIVITKGAKTTYVSKDGQWVRKKSAKN